MEPDEITPAPPARSTPPASLELLAGQTNVVAAHTGYGQVIDELRQMEPRLESLFQRLTEKKEELRERAHVDAVPLMGKAMKAAYAAWLSHGAAGADAVEHRLRPPADVEAARRMLGEHDDGPVVIGHSWDHEYAPEAR